MGLIACFRPSPRSPELDRLAASPEGPRSRHLSLDGLCEQAVAELVADAVGAAPGRGLHREAGQRLAQAGAPSLQVAEHLARGAGHGDAVAVEWLSRAAREAAATSPDVAAALLERAAGLMPPGDPGRDRLLAEQAGSLMWAGQVARAEDVCRALLARDHDPNAEGRRRICLGYALMASGRPLRSPGGEATRSKVARCRRGCPRPGR